MSVLGVVAAVAPQVSTARAASGCGSIGPGVAAGIVDDDIDAPAATSPRLP